MMNQTKPQEQSNDDDGADKQNFTYGSAMIPLGASFQPGELDVMVGRGKICREFPGNERFRKLVASKLNDYSAATSKLEKSTIVSSVLFEVRSKSPQGGFIKKDPLTGQWYEVGDFVARERVTQCFRDALQGKYRSSNASKKKRRKEELRRAKESGLSTKKAKTQHHASSPGFEPFAQAPVDGFRSDSSPSISSGHRSSLLERPSTGSSVHSSVSDISASCHFPSLSATSMNSTMRTEAIPMPFQDHQSLEQQLQALQNLNRAGFDQLQAHLPALQNTSREPYPGSWFTAKPEGASSLQLPTANVVANDFAQAANQCNQRGSSPFQSPADQSMAQSLVGIQTGQLGTQWPLTMQHANITASTPIASATNLDTYAEEDDPFEPRPIAEYISQRNTNRSR